ncbi:MAG: tRNA (adenosine(37)-N6)-threonylcarbamoyltransferase complex dimerization subunit type 1 TsaB [Bacilli bacterium]|nr:tRNA (adenosine(37)-N6)-threonylcarbamoyltransferase complex dimerization subunit type 1 TsaB [Bacilli bacterium]
MISLILDSTNRDLNVGLGIDDKLVDFVSYECWQRQSESMIPEIEKLFLKHQINPKDVNEIIVTKGPGSYTGMRIALTIAKIYSYSLNIPCYAISALAALSCEDKTSICLMNARSARSYFGVYKNGNIIISDTIKTNDEVLEFASKHPEYVLCGDLEYLDKEGYKANVLYNLLRFKSEANKVDDIFKLKAVYLKD